MSNQSHIDTEVIRKTIGALEAKQRPSGEHPVCYLHKEDIDQIKSGVTEILKRLADGDTKMALFEHRIAQLERIVFGMVAVILLGVLGALVALVVKSGGVP
jgi:hypothetical protein